MLCIQILFIGWTITTVLFKSAVAKGKNIKKLIISHRALSIQFCPVYSIIFLNAIQHYQVLSEIYNMLMLYSLKYTQLPNKK